jgi:hypothetical protein
VSAYPIFVVRKWSQLTIKVLRNGRVSELSMRQAPIMCGLFLTLRRFLLGESNAEQKNEEVLYFACIL